MARLLKNISKKKGLAPGAVVFVGEQKVEQVKITVLDYTGTELRESEVHSAEDCFPYRDTPSLTWINIDGLHDIELIQKIGRHFNIHALALEDIANTGQRPKLDAGDDYVLLIMKMLYIDPAESRVLSEQFSIIFGENRVISFQERVGDVFDPVRERLRKTNPRERFMNSDYLAYCLMDAIVDHYFVVLEEVANDIELVEDALINNPQTEDLESIHDLKRQLITTRKATWPLREVIGGLERQDSQLIHNSTKPYLRDLYEHTIQVIDTVETFRDIVSGLLDVYLSSVSNKMNEVMKVLTLIATIFIPLGFLAGVYGMNFNTSISDWNMPELGLPYGYIAFWILAVLIGGGLLLFFRHKKWL